MTVPRESVADAVLMERVMAGDEMAISAIYDRYSAMLFGVLMRVLHDQPAAEEVLQDVFLQLWRKPDQFDAQRGALPAWLLVVARNRALSRRRSRPYREMLEDEPGSLAEAFAGPDNLEDEACRRQLAGQVQAALAQLPAEQRQTVELAYFEGMTQSEIALKTGSPLGTVKTRTRTAMQSLKQLLMTR